MEARVVMAEERSLPGRNCSSLGWCRQVDGSIGRRTPDRIRGRGRRAKARGRRRARAWARPVLGHERVYGKSVGALGGRHHRHHGRGVAGKLQLQGGGSCSKVKLKRRERSVSWSEQEIHLTPLLSEVPRSLDVHLSDLTSPSNFTIRVASSPSLVLLSWEWVVLIKFSAIHPTLVTPNYVMESLINAYESQESKQKSIMVRWPTGSNYRFPMGYNLKMLSGINCHGIELCWQKSYR